MPLLSWTHIMLCTAMSATKMMSRMRLNTKRPVMHGPSSMNVTSIGVTVAVKASATKMMMSHTGMNFEVRGSIIHLSPRYSYRMRSCSIAESRRGGTLAATGRLGITKASALNGALGPCASAVVFAAVRAEAW